MPPYDFVLFFLLVSSAVGIVPLPHYEILFGKIFEVKKKNMSVNVVISLEKNRIS